jgi:hypothetical protein
MKFPIVRSKVSNSETAGGQWKVRVRGEDIRAFIFDNIEKHPKDIAGVTASRFGITRQAANKHLQKLTVEGALKSEGKTRHRSYKLAPLSEWDQAWEISTSLEEDQVWRQDVSKAIGSLPINVMDIWSFCVTEMVNNAKDHSGGTELEISVTRTASNTQILISDNGVGIFKKIQNALNLLDERHAILELSKGKLTTDPQSHTGQGIFFTSRMVDTFGILSGGVYFGHQFGKEEDWIMEPEQSQNGTTVFLKLNNHTARTIKSVSEEYSTGEADLAFTKTVVPVKLAQYGSEKLISRSQAKRLMARVDRFKVVMLDFIDVETIGQAFADEIFRIFVRDHPDIDIYPINTNPEVGQAIAGARANLATEVGGI